MADECNNFEERIAIRSDQFDNLPCGRAGVEKILRGSHDVLKRTIWSCPVFGITGRAGRAAKPRMSALAP